jgi:glutamyl-tRNA synthetase
MDDIKKIALKFVLYNALKYGKPERKAVIGKILGENPELKPRIGEILSVVDELIDEISSIKREEIEERLINLAPELMEEKKEKRERGLPPLPMADKGVVMRFAPNPNGPATLGSARGIVINHEYVSLYDGTFILRFDDTDPKNKRPMLEAYEQYLKDCEWLSAKPDRVLYASKRMGIYYEHVEKLMKMGKAYACFCSREKFKKFKDAGRPCSHRNCATEDTLTIWENMLSGEYDEGEVVIRVKTDMAHKDPALRDWVAFRIVKIPHPLVGDKYNVWPTLDFESAIEDRINGVTHILRGKDLMDSERRQQYIYNYFGWDYPFVKLWGRVKIHEFGKFSTSVLKRKIESGEYTGWDDPRLPTLVALKRRGITPEAIRNFFVQLGVGENDISVSMKNLYAENRKLIDPVANRYFFVWDPVKVIIHGFEGGTARIPLNPKKDGERILKTESEVVISYSDIQKFQNGDIFRLKDLCNIRIISLDPPIAEFVGYELDAVRRGKNIVHWLPAKDNLPCVVHKEGDLIEGVVETSVKNEIDRVVQFERFGFVRIEQFKEKVTAIFAHE